jgi:predicted metal-dependent phosphoesterase TrpH
MEALGMIIDMHVHESKYSSDSHFTLEEAVARAKKVGLDAICITNHESSDIFDEAHEYSKKSGFTVLVGAEILTYEGDLLVFGVKDIPKHKMHASELAKLAAKHKGITISAHPFRNNNRGLGEHIRTVQAHLSGVEAFNGSTLPHHNLSAYTLATELNLPSVGSSDAHILENLGKYATVFQDRVRDERDLIEAIRQGNVIPTMLREGKYHTIDIYRSGDEFDIAGRAAV